MIGGRDGFWTGRDLRRHAPSPSNGRPSDRGRMGGHSSGSVPRQLIYSVRSPWVAPGSPWCNSRCIRRAPHPGGRRCASVEYRRYSRSARLVRRARRSSRCDAGLAPRTARCRFPAGRGFGEGQHLHVGTKAGSYPHEKLSFRQCACRLATSAIPLSDSSANTSRYSSSEGQTGHAAAGPWSENSSDCEARGPSAVRQNPRALQPSCVAALTFGWSSAPTVATSAALRPRWNGTLVTTTLGLNSNAPLIRRAC